MVKADQTYPKCYYYFSKCFDKTTQNNKKSERKQKIYPTIWLAMPESEWLKQKIACDKTSHVINAIEINC